MPMTVTSENMVVNQLPQPTRPLNSYDMSFETPSTAYPQDLQNSKPSNVPQSEENIIGHSQQSIDQSYIHVVPPTMTKQEEGERKVVLLDKLVNRVLNEYEKLSASLGDQINQEEVLAKEKETNTQVKSHSTTSRGIKRPVEVALPEKLERFKIRTVVAEEVVKDEVTK